MHLTDYTARAAATAVYRPEVRVEYTGFGLVSEVGELLEKWDEGALDEIPGEVGDSLWYAAMVLRENGLVLDVDLAAVPAYRDRADLRTEIDRAVIAACYFAGRLKKRIRDGRETVPDAILVETIQKLLAHLDAVCVLSGTTLVDVADGNTDKLADRQRRGVLTGSGDHR